MLSVAIIARDEERHIRACLESTDGLADEIVVLLDNRSRDRTAAICADYGAHVLIEPWVNFSAQRNRALHLCRGDWVLFVDADERVTHELRHEIAALLRTPRHLSSDGSPVVGYWIPRHNMFFGKVVYGGGWYPDRQLRLLHRAHAHYDEQQLVHETALLDGAAGQLNHHFLHYNIETLGEFWHKQSVYALAESRTRYRAGRRARWRNFVGAPAREFWRRYITLQGWRDGWLGFFLCGSLAWFEVVSYACLWLIQSIPHSGSRGGADTPVR